MISCGEPSGDLYAGALASEISQLDPGVDIVGLGGGLKPRMDLTVRIPHADGTTDKVTVTCRIDTLDEIEYFKNGGILPFVLRNLMKAA